VLKRELEEKKKTENKKEDLISFEIKKKIGDGEFEA